MKNREQRWLSSTGTWSPAHSQQHIPLEEEADWWQCVKHLGRTRTLPPSTKQRVNNTGGLCLIAEVADQVHAVLDGFFSNTLCVYSVIPRHKEWAFAAPKGLEMRKSDLSKIKRDYYYKSKSKAGNSSASHSPWCQQYLHSNTNNPASNQHHVQAVPAVQQHQESNP